MLDVVRVADPRLLHRLAGALHHAGNAGLAHEHMVGFLGQHKAAGARKRIEARLRQRLELHLAVAVGEISEHEERQPVRRLLIEGAEHARRVGIARAALQQRFRFLAAVGAEIFLQQIDHGPEVTALFDVDLEQIAHVVERGRGLAEVTLLLDRGRLGVALDDHQAAQHGAVFAGHFLPGVLAFVHAEGDLAALVLRGQQHAPAVFRHLHVVEFGPALGIDADRGAQIDQRFLEALRPHVVPPVEVAGVPLLQRALDARVLPERDVVGDQAVIVDCCDIHELRPLVVSRAQRSALAVRGRPRIATFSYLWDGPGSAAHHFVLRRIRGTHRHTLSLLNVGDTPLP